MIFIRDDLEGKEKDGVLHGRAGLGYRIAGFLIRWAGQDFFC